MSNVKDTWLRFPPSDSPDVVTNKIYVTMSPDAVTADSPSFDIGNTINADGLVEVNLKTIPEMSTMDGVYNVGVVAVDDRGNESSMTLANDIPLDFLAPNPVGSLDFSEN
jgi:hypothetical protein